MKEKVFIILTAVMFLWASVSSAKQSAYQIDENQSALKFSFKSTLHSVEGTAKKFDGTLLIDSEGGFLIHSANVDFDISSMDTKNSKRDEDMKKMFQSDLYPKITFIMADQSFPAASNEALLRGKLTIRNISQPVEINAHLEKIEGGYILSGEAQLSLKAFSLKPPSVIGLIRVFDPVKIKFKIFLKES